jgi:hypothetical protein
VLPAADVLHLFADELASLRRGGFPLPLISARSSERRFFRHL